MKNSAGRKVNLGVGSSGSTSLPRIEMVVRMKILLPKRRAKRIPPGGMRLARLFGRGHPAPRSTEHRNNLQNMFVSSGSRNNKITEVKNFEKQS